MNRVWMAVTVAANTHSDQAQKLRSGLNSINHAKGRLLSGGAEAADLRPLAGIVNSDSGAKFLHGEEEKSRQKEESLRQVMYMNCWGPS